MNERIVVPDDFDEHDLAFLASIELPDEVFVEQMVTIISWADGHGGAGFRVVNASGAQRLSSTLGMLEMAKHWLFVTNPLDAEPDDDDEESSAPGVVSAVYCDANSSRRPRWLISKSPSPLTPRSPAPPPTA